MPAVLYVKGDISDLSTRLVIAAVGTRDATPYGMKAAAWIADGLSRFGAIVVSGMAVGIDSAAARSACKSLGKVVGVLGSGIDVLYPKQNRSMMKKMTEHGHALITEYPPGTKPYPGNFPLRNRIITGLSMGVVIIEAPFASGALISANHAIEQGRDVFVVPGRIGDKTFLGSMQLISQGLKAVTSIEDILGEYEQLYPEKLKEIYDQQLKKMENMRAEEIKRRAKRRLDKTASSVGKGGESVKTDDIKAKEVVAAPDLKPQPEVLTQLDETEGLVYSKLSGEPLSLEELANLTGLPIGSLLPAITELELCGLLRAVAANRYIICERP